MFILSSTSKGSDHRRDHLDFEDIESKYRLFLFMNATCRIRWIKQENTNTNHRYQPKAIVWNASDRDVVEISRNGVRRLPGVGVIMDPSQTWYCWTRDVSYSYFSQNIHNRNVVYLRFLVLGSSCLDPLPTRRNPAKVLLDCNDTFREHQHLSLVNRSSVWSHVYLNGEFSAELHYEQGRWSYCISQPLTKYCYNPITTYNFHVAIRYPLSVNPCLIEKNEASGHTSRAFPKTQHTFCIPR